MIFYVSLLLICVAVSIVIVWFYRSFAEVTKAAYRALLPSSRHNHKHHNDHLVKHVSLSATPSPWGWESNGAVHHSSPIKKAEAVQEPVAPWGWKGNRRNADIRKPEVGENFDVAAYAFKDAVSRAVDRVSPAKEYQAEERENFEFAGKKYKVVRKRKAAKRNPGGNAKPWGW